MTIAISPRHVIAIVLFPLETSDEVQISMRVFITLSLDGHIPLFMDLIELSNVDRPLLLRELIVVDLIEKSKNGR